MIRCSRCQNTVDETRQSACPVCLAPLAAPGAVQGPAMPVYTPPPGTGIPPARSPQAPASTRPYAPPPGSPVGAPPPAAAYAPPPGSPYAAAPVPGSLPAPPAPPPIGLAPMPGYAPGYAPPVHTRTTLTGEVVETTAPAPGYVPSYAPGNYAPPGTAPYGNGYPMPVSSRPPPPAKTGGWNPLTWKIAGGGTFTALYIAARIFAIIARNMHPSTPTNYEPTSPVPSYSTGMRQSYSSGASNPSFAPAPYRNTTLPTQPSSFPTTGNMRSQSNFPNRFQRPNMPTPPNFPSHFQPPNMPTSPRGFSGPSGMPGGDFSGPRSTDPSGNP